jgi:hypothetical protein
MSNSLEGQPAGKVYADLNISVPDVLTLDLGDVAAEYIAISSGRLGEVCGCCVSKLEVILRERQ